MERGYIQQEIQESAYRYQKEIESGNRIIVGLNRFQVKESPDRELLQVDPAVRDIQIRRITALRASRNAQLSQGSLERMKSAARGTANLMLPILDCVRALCTLGEICDGMREIFGEYRPS